MLIVCPNCSRSYLVRAAELGQPGRLVRCSVCQTSWRADGATSEGKQPSEHDAEMPVPASLDDAPLSMPKRPLRRHVAMGAAALAGLTLLAGYEKFDWVMARAMGWIDAVIPSSDVAGLSFANIRTTLGSEGGETALMIEGDILSDSNREKSLPPLQFTMRDGTESVIFQWMIPAPAATIVKGEPVPFKARLASPPRDGKDIRIRFSGA